MSGQQCSDNFEKLFAFELMVEYIRIENETKVSDKLALGVRLLDFPTLLIYQPQRRTGQISQAVQNGNDKPGVYTFNRGKSCFFKMNLKSLHANLSSSPLYVMVLDVKEDIPKFVGSSVISLANVVDRIKQDVTEHGVSASSSHGERGLACVRNLTGDKIGSINVTYKLLSLGASLHQHIKDRGAPKDVKVHREQHLKECITENNMSTELATPESSSSVDRSDGNRLADVKHSDNENENDDACVDKKHTVIPETLEKSDNEDDLSVFCPPRLYYNNHAEEKGKTEEEEEDFNLPQLDPDVFRYEESEDELSQNEPEDPSSLMIHQQVRQNVTTSSNQKSSLNVLGEALRQLPLLNALLVELSQLNDQNPQQPLSIHPNLSWIYRPASTEPSAGHRSSTLKAQVKSLQNSEHLEELAAPRNCSTPILRPLSVKKNDKREVALKDNNFFNRSSKKKLVYGTTKTFNLRLKQISPALKRHECMVLIQNDTKSSVAKEKMKSNNKIIRSSKRKSVLTPSFSLNENIETMIVSEESTIQGTITLKQNNMRRKPHGKLGRDSQTISEQHSLSELDLKCIHIPNMNSDSVARNKDKNEHHSESNQSCSDSDRHREKIESLRSSKQSSPKSSLSDSGGEESEEADYADDFNSLEPSEAYSPDPLSSPELYSKTKTQKSSVCPNFGNSDSDSESVQKRAALPQPIKAPSSPQRALRGTHIIRPKTQASALSFSSDDATEDGSTSLQSVCSRKKMTKSIKMEMTSEAESFVSSRGEGNDSTKASGPVKELSADSVSSFGLQEEGEMGDKLGSLDFRKEYQHISELVTGKLPGYTM